MPLAPSSPISHSINDNNKKELPSGQVKRRSKEAKFSESRVFFQGISDCFSPIIPNFVTYTKMLHEMVQSGHKQVISRLSLVSEELSFNISPMTLASSGPMQLNVH